MAILLELPFTVVERTDLACLQPPGDAVEVESVIADSPGDRTLLSNGWGMVRLAFYAEVHDVVPAYGTVVHDYVPGPQGYGVPFLDFEPLLRDCIAAAAAATGKLLRPRLFEGSAGRGQILHFTIKVLIPVLNLYIHVHIIHDARVVWSSALEVSSSRK